MKKEIKYTRHAKRRMKWRKITEEEVRLTLLNPDQTEDSIKGRINACKTIGFKYIKVTYKEWLNEILIISVVNKA
ncbi:MAG: DUF4258 domain-containing protein [Bacillota bacterium]